MFKLDNLDSFQKKLDKIAKQVQDLEGTRSIPFEELFTKNFLNKYTNFNSLDELFEKCSINSDEDLENNIELLNSEVKHNSDFSSWHEMLDVATSEYYEEQMNNFFK